MNAAGRFAFEALPVGAIELRVLAEGYRELVVPIAAGTEPIDIEVELRRDLPDALIRGTARNFKGQPVKGRATVQPGGRQVVLDSEGQFELEVPPGTYTVSVHSPGCAAHKREVRVEKNDVSVIIVELRAEP